MSTQKEEISINDELEATRLSFAMYCAQSYADSLLHVAARLNNTEYAVYFLEKHENDIHKTNNKGQTALNICAELSNIKVMRLITLKWQTKAVKENDESSLNSLTGIYKSPIMLYALKSYTAKELADLLNTKINGKSVNYVIQNGSGWTPLHAGSAMTRLNQHLCNAVLLEQYNLQQLEIKSTAQYIGRYKSCNDAEYSVIYPAGSTVSDIAECHLKQGDKFLTEEQKNVLRETIKFIDKKIEALKSTQVNNPKLENKVVQLGA